MSELINLIKTAEDFTALGSATGAKIEQAETALGLSFASDYRKYVTSFGVATFSGRELTGICNSTRLNVVAATERARNYFPKFPANAYVVEELMFDHIIIIQDSTKQVYSYGPNDKSKRIAKSLQEYLFSE